MLLEPDVGTEDQWISSRNYGIHLPNMCDLHGFDSPTFPKRKQRKKGKRKETLAACTTIHN